MRIVDTMATLLLSVSVVACASSQTGGGLVTGQVRPAMGGARVLILPVPDGIERQEGPAGGTGAEMTAAIRDELIKRGAVPLVTEATSLEGALLHARNLGYEYVLKAVLTEWEDNATEWSARADSAAVSAELYNSETATLISTATHREKGSSLALTSLDPKRYVARIAERVVARLFGFGSPSTRYSPARQTPAEDREIEVSPAAPPAETAPVRVAAAPLPGEPPPADPSGNLQEFVVADGLAVEWITRDESVTGYRWTLSLTNHHTGDVTPQLQLRLLDANGSYVHTHEWTAEVVHAGRTAVLSASWRIDASDAALGVEWDLIIVRVDEVRQ